MPHRKDVHIFVAMEVSDESRTSLLDVVRERYNKAGRTSQTARMVVVLNLNPKAQSAPEDSEGWHDAFIKANNSDDEDRITGLLLCMPESCVHIVEGPSKKLYQMLHELQSVISRRKDSTRIFTQGKVVVSTQDITSRAFRRWGCKVMGGTRAEARDRDPEPAGMLVSEVYHKLLRVGNKFAECQDDESYDKLLVNIRSKCQGLLPIGDEPQAFLIAPDCATIRTFLQIYDSPVSINLYSGLVNSDPLHVSAVIC